MEKLIKEIEKFSEKYQFSFHFWGTGSNNVIIRKNYVELYSTGGWLSPVDAIIDALNYIYRINRVPKVKRVC